MPMFRKTRPGGKRFKRKSSNFPFRSRDRLKVEAIESKFYVIKSTTTLGTILPLVMLLQETKF